MKNPIFTKKILATGIILSLFSSYIPVSYVGPNMIQTVKANSQSENNEIGIEFFDVNGEKIEENGIFDTKDGENVTLNVKVTFPENSTNNRVTLQFGNFVRIINDGRTNEALKLAVANFSNITRTPLTPLTGGTYRGGYNTKETITYTAKEGIKSFTIPLIVKVDKVGGMLGISENGEINGLREGIERDIPLRTTVTSTKNNQNIEKISKISTFAMSTLNINYIVHNWINSGLVPNPTFISANTENNYQAITGYWALGLNVPASDTSKGVESYTYDLVLPAGVSFLEDTTGVFEKVSENTEEGGKTRIKMRMKQAFFGGWIGLYNKVQIDRNIITGDRVDIRFENHMIKFRNYDEKKNFYIGNYKTGEGATRPDSVYTIRVFDTKDGNNISFFNNTIPGVGGGYYTNLDLPQVNNNFYTVLGSYTYNTHSFNFSNEVSRPKEIHYNFPENEYTEMKGFHLPIGPLNTKTNPIRTIKVKTKNEPKWKTIDLGKDFYVENRTSSEAFVDVVSLGYSADDILTEAIIPVGTIGANAKFTPYIINRTGFFGKIKKIPETTKTIKTVDVTFRDENYDPNSSDRNHNHGTGAYNLGLNVNASRIEATFSTDSTKTVEYGKTGTIISRAVGSVDHWEKNTVKVKKYHLVLDKDIKVKNVKFKKDNVYFTSELSRTEGISGDKKIYTFDFAGVTDEKEYIGFIGKPGQGFREHSFFVEVEVENDVLDQKNIAYEKMNFLEVERLAKNARYPNSMTDPYDVDGDGLTTTDTNIFTNYVATSNFMRLNTLDRIDLTSEAKLSNQEIYTSANESFKIKNITENLDLKYKIENKLSKEVGNIDLYLPIPKKGQNFGTNFQTKAFDYGLKLLGKAKLSEGLEDIFDISYAEVDSTKLNGTRNLTISELEKENFQTNPNSFENINLMRIKTKAGVKIPAKSSYDLETSLELLNITEADDGKNISWKPYYSAIYDQYSKVENARDISVDISLGKLALEVYNDANTNGTKDTENPIDTEIELFDENGVKIANKRTTNGKVMFDGLVSGKKYKAFVINPDKNVYHFTSGTALADESKSSKEIVAELREENSLTVHNIGLSDVVSAIPVINTIKTNSTEITGTGVANAKIEVTLPNGTKKQTTVDTNGIWKVTLTDSEKTSLTVNSNVKVTQKENFKKLATANKVVEPTEAESNRLNLPVKTKVDNINTLTEDEKNKVKDEVKKANPTLNDDQITVDNLGNVTVRYPDNSTNTLTKELTVIQKTDSEKNSLNEPAKTKVDNLNNLTDDEKSKVKEEVKKVNPTLNDDQISVDNLGNVTVRYPDNTINTLTKELTVIQKTDSEKSTLNEPAKTKVDNLNNLTDDEKSKVKDEVKKANPTLNLDQISVDSQGNVTVTYADNSTKNLDKSKTVIQKTDSEKNSLNEPAKTKVDNLNNLTDDEKSKVKDEVKKANPSLNDDQISVDSQGNVTVTYADNSTKNLDKSKTVIQKTDSEKSTLNEPVKTKVDDINSLTEDEKNKVKDEVKKANPTLNLDQIFVDTQGNVTVTYADNSTKNLDKSKTVIQKTDSEKSTLNEPVKTKVDDINSLTEDEKNKVKDEVKKANPTLNLDQISVDSQGNVTVTYADNSTNTLTKELTVIAKTDSEKSTLNEPVKTKVDDINSLTEDEKNKVKDEVKKANPTLNLDQISVDSQGNVTVTYADNSTKNLDKSKTVIQKTDSEKSTLNEPVKTKVDDINSLTEDEKNKVKDEVKKANPTLNLDQISVDSQGNVTVTYADNSTKNLDRIETVYTIPEVEVTGEKVRKIGENFDLTLTPRNGNITEVLGLPNGLKFENNKITGKNENLGKYKITIKLSDGNKDSEFEFEIEVTDLLKPSKTLVDHHYNLTNDEKDKVKNEIIKVNPFLTKDQIEVQNNGNTIIKFSDGTTKELPPYETIIQKFLGSAPKPEDLVLKDDPRVNTIITSIIEKTKDIIEKISENKNKEEVELNSAPEKTENKEKTINGETRKYSLNKEDTACPMIPNIVGDFNKEFELTFKDMVSIQNLDEVQRLTKVDILNKKGVNNTDLFEPNRGITRAEFLAIVLKAHCYDISVKPDSLPFYDVDLDSWQAKVVKVGVEEGIIKGYEADEKGVSFRPNRPISKIEAFAIMIKMREIKISDDIKDSYIDKKANWQKEPLATGEYLGILNPEKSNFKFYPDSILTRDEMVKYIVDIVRLY